MKSIIWKIELAAAVLLAVSALVWGLRPGVWNYGGFYRMAAGEQSRTAQSASAVIRRRMDFISGLLCVLCWLDF